MQWMRNNSLAICGSDHSCNTRLYTTICITPVSHGCRKWPLRVSHLTPTSSALPPLAGLRSCACSERQVWRSCNAALASETDVRCGPRPPMIARGLRWMPRFEDWRFRARRRHLYRRLVESRDMVSCTYQQGVSPSCFYVERSILRET